MTRTGEKRSMPNWLIGLVFVIVLAIASFVAFTKNVPWGGGTEFAIVFEDAQNVRPNSPVRIAGVEVGKVKSIEPLATADVQATAQTAEGDEVSSEATQTATMVTVEVNDDALPLKQDATFRMRPRLFLEGNYFVDISPGSPSAPPVEAGHTFSLTQSSSSVQLDRIFTDSLQKDAREDLQTLLDEFGTALIDGGGAESFRKLYKVSPGAYKNTAIVAEATLGNRPHDLSGLIFNLEKVVDGLGSNEQALQDTVSNFRTVTGSFAAEDAALEQAIVELPQFLEVSFPALNNLNAALPPLRAFAREALPGVESTPATLDSATPLFAQLADLSTKAELRGLVADLIPTVPRLALLSRRTEPFLEEARLLASCFNEVIIPWANDEIDGGPDYPHPAYGSVFEETGYGLVGLGGESRSQDANGQYIRIEGGGGLNTVAVENPAGETSAGVTQFPIEGAMPPINSSLKTPFRPEKPCENQEPPNLSSLVGPGPEQSTVSPGTVPTEGPLGAMFADSQSLFDTLTAASEAAEAGDAKAAKQLAKQAAEIQQDYDEDYGN